MSHIIRQQPDGRWCLFSTITEDFIMENVGRNDIATYYIEQEAARIEHRLNEIESGDFQPRHLTLKTYDDLVERSNRRN